MPALITTVLVSAAIAHGGLADHDHEVQIEERDGYRFIVSNGIPDHETGAFPNRGNPHSIREQRHRFRVTLRPAAAAELTPLGLHPFGVATNGVPFDPNTAEWWRNDRRSGWHVEAASGRMSLGLDASHAHVQPTGAYHYHGIPSGIMASERAGDAPAMPLLGWAADGFPIYGPWGYADPHDASSGREPLRSSYRLKSGSRPGSPAGPGGAYDGTYVEDWEYVSDLGHLDEANGRFGVTPEFPQGTYYYVITDTFPYVPRYFRGTPDSSFMRHRPQRGREPGRGRPGDRPPPPRPPR